MEAKTFKYLIVGGGVAGVTAAETIRQKEPETSIAVVNDEPYALYSRVMLSKPNFFLGKVPFDQVWLKSRDWYDKNKIDFIGSQTVAQLNPAGKMVQMKDGSMVQYDKLLLATGVGTRKWTVPGADKKGIHYLRTLEDGKAIMEGLKGAHRAVTIGAGFISFEMADLLNLAGLETTMVIRESHFWEPILDAESGLMIEQALQKAGVKIIKNAEVEEVVGQDTVEGVVLKSGEKLQCDMIVCGIGVVSEIDWVKQAGIATNRGIVASEYLETSAPDVWTAGDIAEYKDLLLGERILMGNWVNAREQGRIAGLNMTGEKRPFKFVSFYTTQGVGISIAFVGDVAPGKDRLVIPRGSPDINSYARLMLDGGHIVGATLINRTAELTTLARLIEHGVDVSGKHKELGDPTFDLKTLLV